MSKTHQNQELTVCNESAPSEAVSPSQVTSHESTMELPTPPPSSRKLEDKAAPDSKDSSTEHNNLASNLESTEAKRRRKHRRYSSSRFSPFAQDELLFNRYQIREEIGRGSMGIVYHAWDLKLKRSVALKTLREETSQDPYQVERFRREIESLSGLRHANIVSVYDFGLEEGRFWFVMDRIEGRTLSALIETQELGPRRAFEILLPIAKALAHAHENSLIHRDIKPENILIDANDSPYLTDFGLAFHANRNQRLTDTGYSVGTPAFMAPEQISGLTRAVDQRTDIYSLGATIYECLVGNPPFAKSENYAELVYRIVNEEPKPPRQLRTNLARDAEAICLKCIDKEPRLRYQTMHELIADIERFLRGEAVLASQPRLVTRIQRQIRRNWSTYLVILVCFLCLAGAGILMVLQQKRVQNLTKISDKIDAERRRLLRLSKSAASSERLKNARQNAFLQSLQGIDTRRKFQPLRNLHEQDSSSWESEYYSALILAQQAAKPSEPNKQQHLKRAARILANIQGLRPFRITLALLAAELAFLGNDLKLADSLWQRVIQQATNPDIKLTAQIKRLSLYGRFKEAANLLDKHPECLKYPGVQSLQQLLIKLNLLKTLKSRVSTVVASEMIPSILYSSPETKKLTCLYDIWLNLTTTNINDAQFWQRICSQNGLPKTHSGSIYFIMATRSAPNPDLAKKLKELQSRY